MQPSLHRLRMAKLPLARARRCSLFACAAQQEIEKVKKRREERALERVQQEEELSMIARERAIAEGVELEAKEEKVRMI